MKKREALSISLRGLRAALGAAALHCDAAIEILEGPAPAEPGPGVVLVPSLQTHEAPATYPEKADCTHEHRRPDPSRKDPGRAVCLNPKCFAVVPGIV
jgi:hypothetical protein